MPLWPIFSWHLQWSNICSNEPYFLAVAYWIHGHTPNLIIRLYWNCLVNLPISIISIYHFGRLCMHTSKRKSFFFSGERIFHPVSSTADIIKMLQTVDGELLSRSTFQNLISTPDPRRIGNLIWAPVVERKWNVFGHSFSADARFK